jgi:hypothetical protein
MTPRTAAGRALAKQITSWTEFPAKYVDAILAIEAEAAPPAPLDVPTLGRVIHRVFRHGVHGPGRDDEDGDLAAAIMEEYARLAPLPRAAIDNESATTRPVPVRVPEEGGGQTPLDVHQRVGGGGRRGITGQPARPADAALREALSLARSMILAGEQMTSQAAAMIDNALAAQLTPAQDGGA